MHVRSVLLPARNQRTRACAHHWLAALAHPSLRLAQQSRLALRSLLTPLHLPGQVCQAQAQVVVGHRAEQRGSPLTLLCSLYVGAWELFETAAMQLKAQASKVCSLGEQRSPLLASACMTWSSFCMREHVHASVHAQ